MRYTVVLDANVLYPAPLRDLFMRLALSDLFSARWTAQIHDEWIRNVLAKRPDLKPEQLQRTRQLMDSHVRDCLVEGYEPLIEGLNLPDPDDRHVLAAAIKCGAQAIITFNLKDFPASKLKQFEIEAKHPDEFLAYQLDLDPALVCNVVRQHRAALKRPPKSIGDYLDTLETNGLAVTANILRRFAEML
ncbi:PIN domain-containing protein [Zooshikella harenae]|uniref:PIN domain-containing protein n=1 Tax=Zooshikella harenae TaxID=2827238 RepID=A0ABS5ZJ86_9GAMM|nr:PIN domain-containing protein [Zooshikella harenae]MBU2714010.1 PIN domain-containing protein [Zooshikella harenae]